MSFESLIKLGRKIDGGLNGESILISLTGVNLKKESCTFSESMGVTRNEVFKTISTFRANILKQLSQFLHSEKNESALCDLLKKIRSI